jgi:hypothetical protein
MYGKYFVGKRKLAVIALTGILRGGRREEGGGRREEATPLPHPIDPELSVDNPIM